MAEDVTVGQLIEFVNKNSREQTVLLEQIAKGEIARSQLQQMITKSRRSPRERLARSLLRKAQSPRLTLSLFKDGYPSSRLSVDTFAEIAAVYELLGESEVANKITYQGGDESAIYMRRIQALCEKNDLEHARKLAHVLHDDSKSLAWTEIAGKSQQQSDYDQVKSTNFAVKLAVAASHAREDQGRALEELFIDNSKKPAGPGHEFFEILATMAKEHARQKRIQESRVIVFKLDSHGYLQLEAAHAIAQASKDPSDVDYYRRRAARIFTRSELLKHAVHLAHIAAITGDEKDFAACNEMIEQSGTPHSQHKAEAYSALALAYAERGDILTARSIVNKIVVPDVEARTFAQMARIVLSQPE